MDLAEVHHCDGLLLCITRDNRSVVVWNPCLGETRWLQRKNVCPSGCTSRYNEYIVGLLLDRRKSNLTAATKSLCMGEGNHNLYESFERRGEESGLVL